MAKLKLDRNSIKEAERLTEFLLKDKTIREEFLKFLSNAISYAKNINDKNWNLNLDKNGKFIRFNVGHEYCIEIFHDRVHILCLKESLKKDIGNKILNIEFKGYDKNGRVLSNNINSVPDCLVKVPDSVGCHLKHENISEYLHVLKKSNIEFIDYAIRKTKQIPSMTQAHSPGVKNNAKIDRSNNLKFLGVGIIL